MATIVRRVFRAGLAVRSVLALVALLFLSQEARAADLIPRPQLLKTARTIIGPEHDPGRITVKFKDGLHIRLRNGTLSDEHTGALAEAQAALNAVAAGQWRRSYPIPEAQLDQWRLNAQANLGKVVADLNLQFDLILPQGLDAGAAIDSLNSLLIVELAQPAPRPVPPPLPPNFQNNQSFLPAAPNGIDALGTWAVGTTGTGVRIADVEYSWNLSHQDLPLATLVGPSPIDPFGDTNHGTAVLGELASRSNGWGTTGVAYNSALVVAAANTNFGYSVSAAILNAMTVLMPGDVILIEQQWTGPNGGDNYVPVEWYLPNYNAIVTAVGNGITVVEAAGNGGENLDAPIFSSGNGGHWPFLAQNDSGAIIVGAGDEIRSRMWFSCYGSTVDLQGLGQNVWTTGYGDTYSGEGVNLYYTGFFGGTSSASPIVAGAVALFQSRKVSLTGVPATPAEVRTWLRQTGSPQQSGGFPASQNIGPLPNVTAALQAAGLIQANDHCSNALLKGVGSHAFTTVSATTDGPNEPASCNDNGYTHIEKDVWYKVLAQCTGTMTISLCGATFNAKMAVYPSCPSVSGTPIACNDDFCGTSPQVSFPVVSGTLKWIRIGGFNAASGTGTMVVSCTPGPPPCPEDLSGDTTVGTPDLLLLINAWGPCAGCPADLNNDGGVGTPDLLLLINAWGPC